MFCNVQEGSESDLVLSKADAEEAAEYDGIIPLAARTQQGFDGLVKAVQAAPGTLQPSEGLDAGCTRWVH